MYWWWVGKLMKNTKIISNLNSKWLVKMCTFIIVFNLRYMTAQYKVQWISYKFKKSWICSDEIMSKNSFNRCWYEVSRVEREDDTRECFWVMGLVIIYLIPYSNNAHNISRVYNYRILAYWNRELSQVIKIQHTINYSLLRFI